VAVDQEVAEDPAEAQCKTDKMKKQKASRELSPSVTGFHEDDLLQVGGASGRRLAVTANRIVAIDRSCNCINYLKPRFPKPSDLFHGEDFDRGRLISGNKTTAVGGSCKGRIAIFA
jgi:hypothetical protein